MITAKELSNVLESERAQSSPSALGARRPARLIDLWDAWLFAAADATLALGDWSCAPDSEKSHSYAAYRAALDREEQAALMLEWCSPPQRMN
jgi:hypothetical protein